MKNYIILFLKESLGFNQEIEEIISNQNILLQDNQQLLENDQLLLQKLTELKENQKNEVGFDIYEYLTISNALCLLTLLSLIAGGLWLYNNDSSISILESIKDLGTLSKDLHELDSGLILEALNKLNESTANLSRTELKILLEIRNILLTKGINVNEHLKRPLDLKGQLIFGQDSND